jgi:hypothetical protein
MQKDYTSWYYENIILPEFAKLTKRAKKFNVNLELKVIDTFTKLEESGFYHWNGDPIMNAVEMVTVELTGADMVINGWTVIARIEHESVGNIVMTYKEIPESYREDTKGHCDHCHSNRFRKTTYVLENEAEELKQVGKSCLKDFFATDPASILFKESCSSFLDDEESSYGGGHHSRVWDIEESLQVFVMIIRRHGYTSKKKAEEEYRTSTASYFYDYHDDLLHNKSEWEKHFEFPTEDDKKLASDVLNWIKTNDIDTDYMKNLKAIVSNDYTKGKYLGYIGSAIPAYQRALNIEVERRKQSLSQFVGTEGARIEVELTVTKIIGIDSHWGICHLYIMEDQNGNVFKWKSSNAELEQDKIYKLKGTVKAHNTYYGINQTELTRCKLA